MRPNTPPDPRYHFARRIVLVGIAGPMAYYGLHALVWGSSMATWKAVCLVFTGTLICVFSGIAAYNW